MLWDQALQAFAAGNLVTGCGFLYRARREALKLTGGKSASAAKESLKSLQSAYDELLNPICGGKDNKSAPPAAEVEGVFLDVLRMLQSAFSMLVGAYKENMRQLGALGLVFGAVMVWVDIASGLPPHWALGEGPFILVLGAALYVLAGKVRAAAGGERRTPEERPQGGCA